MEPPVELTAEKRAVCPGATAAFWGLMVTEPVCVGVGGGWFGLGAGCEGWVAVAPGGARLAQPDVNPVTTRHPVRTQPAVRMLPPSRHLPWTHTPQDCCCAEAGICLAS